MDELSKLDTAFTIQSQRNLFLELLSKCNYKQFMNGYDQLSGRNLIEWMSRRNIKFDALTLSSDTLNSSTIGIFNSETLTTLSCSHFWQQKHKLGDHEVVSQVNRLFSSIPNLSIIKLNNSKFVTGTDVTIKCPHLTSCDFTFLTNLTDDFIVNLSKNCPKLTRVVLSQCKLLTGTSIVSLVKSCKKLSFLHISGCKKLTSVIFQSIASDCSQLTGLNLDYCSKTQTTSSETMDSEIGGTSGGEGSFASISHEDAIINIVRSNPLLTELYVSGSDITDKLLLAIAECLPNFRVLDFSDCGQVTDEGLVPLAESCKLLSELIFEPPWYNVTGITQKTFLAIATHRPEFRRFRLQARLITKAVLSVVSMNIDSLDLSAWMLDCSHFRPAKGTNVDMMSTFMKMTTCRSPVFQLFGPYCANAHTYRFNNRPNVDTNMAFLEHMTHIKHLDLVCVSQELRDENLIALLKQIVLLESFVITSRGSDSNKCTHVGISALVEKNPFLTKLDIGGCRELTDVTLAKFAERCKGLKWLNICRSHKTTDEGFRSLAENCRRLQYLDASDCITLTDVGIYNVIARCKELQTFLFNTNNYPGFDPHVKERYEMHFVVDKYAQD